MINFKSIPFLRILLPYLAGILFVQWFTITFNIHLVFGISVSLLIASFLFQKYYKRVTYYKKFFYTVCLNVFFFSLAFETCFIHNDKNSVSHYSHFITDNNQEFMCTVNDLPVNTEKYKKLSVSVNAIQANGKWNYATGNTIIYLKGFKAKSIRIGNTLLIKSGFSYVHPPQNPYEFDYKAFLEHKNVFHVVYADSSKAFEAGNDNTPFSFTRLGCVIKDKIVSIMRSSGLSQQAFSICSALLVGYDDEIEGDVLTSFSHSGTLHVLSVSGMHTGVLYGVLIFLFQFVDKHNRYIKLRCFFIIAILILFVFITGFSPSVLRAALMLGFIILGKTYKKNGNSYNTLLFSAFLLLLYNPLLIKDVGFLLSYLAVFGIMYLYPILNSIYIVKNKYISWFWSLTLMSIAATVFTLPVSLFYFHQFPIWFIFSNLLIIPISIVLMGAAALLLIFYKIAVIKHLIALAINGITAIMLWLTQLTDNKSYGYIDYISFNKDDVFFSTLSIVIILMVFSTKNYRTVLLGCIILIAWLSTSIFTNYKEQAQKELVVFNIRHKTAYVLRLGHTIYANTSTLSEKEFQRFVKPYLLNFSGLTIINHAAPFIKHCNTAVLNLSGPFELPGNADYVIVSNNTALITKTASNFKPLVIADCSNSTNFVKKLRKQCAELGFPFYSIKDEGALSINFDSKKYRYEIADRR